MKNNLTDLITYSFLVAGIFLFTKPNGNGPNFIKSLTGGYSNIVQASTGQTVSTTGA